MRLATEPQTNFQALRAVRRHTRERASTADDDGAWPIKVCRTKSQSRIEDGSEQFGAYLNLSFRSTGRDIGGAQHPAARVCRMTGNSCQVVAAGPADMEPLISVMVLAFAADPVARWMYREPQRYLPTSAGSFGRSRARPFRPGRRGALTAISGLRSCFRRV
jgi:hypothetical protein